MKKKKDILDIILYSLIGLLGAMVAFIILYINGVIKF